MLSCVSAGPGKEEGGVAGKEEVQLGLSLVGSAVPYGLWVAWALIDTIWRGAKGLWARVNWSPRHIPSDVSLHASRHHSAHTLALPYRKVSC